MVKQNKQKLLEAGAEAGRSFQKMTKTHTKTKTKRLLRSTFLLIAQNAPQTLKSRIWGFRLGGAPHKVDLLRRPHTHTHTHTHLLLRMCFFIKGESKDNDFNSKGSVYNELRFQDRILHVQGQQI